MAFNFFRHFAAAKKDGAVQSAIEAIVRWDPKGATEAELRSMEDRLDQIGKQVTSAQVSYNKEKGEADAFRARYDQRLKAVEILKAQADAEQDPTAKAGKQSSLTKFVEETKDLRDQVKLEIDDEVQAKALLDQMQDAYNTTAGKLREARQVLERASRNMQSAEQRKNAAENRAEIARQGAGLTNARNSVDIALKAMQDAAEKSKAEAVVLDNKAKLLTPSDLTKDDANVAAAMRQAEGGKPTASLDDEIKGLAL